MKTSDWQVIVWIAHEQKSSPGITGQLAGSGSAKQCDGPGTDFFGQDIGVYFERKATMAAENITDLVNSLTPNQKDAVREFIRFLKAKGQPETSPFLAAVDEFIDQHPELLHRLAQ